MTMFSSHESSLLLLFLCDRISTAFKKKKMFSYFYVLVQNHLYFTLAL